MEDVLEQLLRDAVDSLQHNAAVPTELTSTIRVTRNRDASQGDYSTSVAMQLAGSLGESPQALALKIVASLPVSSRLRSVQVASPGFINFFVSDLERQAIVPRILLAAERYGMVHVGQGTRVFVACLADADSAVQSCDQGRVAVVGRSLVNVLTAAGCTVECADPAEQHVSVVRALIDCVVSDYDQIVCVLRAEEHETAEQLKAASEGAGSATVQMCLVLVEPASVTGWGQAQKMRGHARGITTCHDLRDEVGTDATNYFFVMGDHQEPLEFNLALAKSPSRSNPVYNVQFAHARICSVMRTARDQGAHYDEAMGLANLSALTDPREMTLMTLLGDYPATISRAAATHEPYRVTSYLQELANGLNKYYEAQKWLVENPPLRNARLCLIQAARQVLFNGLRLIDVSAPEVL